MPIIQITKAVRKGSPLLIDIYSWSGCGKTYSALLLARGLIGPKGKIGFLDTETGRGLVYAGDPDIGDYDYAELTPPFTPERYIEAIDEFEKSDYHCLIIDSASHCWDGLGGVLDIAGESDKKGLLKWANPKARHKKFVNRLLRSRMHIICCVRAKEKMRQEGDRIVSDGFVPIQEKTFIFETVIQLYLPPQKNDVDRGRYVLEKCPKALLGAFPPGEKVTVKTGQLIAEWVRGGAPVDSQFETIRRAAEDVAALGTEKLRAFWELSTTKPWRKQLHPLMDNLKSIAGAADKEHETAQDDPAAPQEPDLSDPFAARLAKPTIVRASTGEPVPPKPPSPIGGKDDKPWLAWIAWAKAELRAMPMDRMAAFFLDNDEFNVIPDKYPVDWIEMEKIRDERKAAA